MCKANHAKIYFSVKARVDKRGGKYKSGHLEYIYNFYCRNPVPQVSAKIHQETCLVSFKRCKHTKINKAQVKANASKQTTCLLAFRNKQFIVFHSFRLNNSAIFHDTKAPRIIFCHLCIHLSHYIYEICIVRATET
jgi:hypothetical protein